MERTPKKLQDIPETVYACVKGDVSITDLRNKLFKRQCFKTTIITSMSHSSVGQEFRQDTVGTACLCSTVSGVN